MAAIDAVIDRDAMIYAAKNVLTEKRDKMLDDYGKNFAGTIKAEFKNAFDTIRNRVKGMYSGDNQLMLLKEIINENINHFVDKVASVTGGNVINNVSEIVTESKNESAAEPAHRKSLFDILSRSKSGERGNRDRFKNKESAAVEESAPSSPTGPAKVSAISADELAKIRAEMSGTATSVTHEETVSTAPTIEQRTEE